MPAGGHIVWLDNTRPVDGTTKRPAGSINRQAFSFSRNNCRESPKVLLLLRGRDLHADCTTELTFFGPFPRITGDISLTFRFSVTSETGPFIEQGKQAREHIFHRP